MVVVTCGIRNHLVGMKSTGLVGMVRGERIGEKVIENDDRSLLDGQNSKDPADVVSDDG